MPIIQSSIESKIKFSLNPSLLSVVNESHLHHHGRSTNTTLKIETHFKIEVVSSLFENKRLLQRHRMINEIIAEEVSQIKACSLFTFTPEEWNQRKDETFNSPRCAGRSQ